LIATQCKFVFKNWHCVLSEDGTRAPKQFGDANAMFYLIETGHFVGTIKGVLWYNKCKEWTILKYRQTPVSAGNTFQDILRLRETAGDTESYI